MSEPSTLALALIALVGMGVRFLRGGNERYRAIWS